MGEVLNDTTRDDIGERQEERDKIGELRARVKRLRDGNKVDTIDEGDSGG